MDVKVKAETVSTGTSWTIDGKKPQQSVISIGAKTGSHTLDFKLNDQTDRELRFNTSDPIWVHETEDDVCPKAGISTDQVCVASCDNKRLTITDENSGIARTLHYQLNFLDTDGNAVSVDPVIKNGGNTFL